MPITQDRMLRLIEAGTEMFNNYTNLLDEARRIFGPRADATDLIASFGPSPKAIETVAEERAHFNTRKNRNNQARRYIARKRREQEGWREEQALREAANLGTIEVNLNELHRLAFAAWKQGSESTISARTIGELAIDLGEPDQYRQAALVTRLEKIGRIQATEIGGEYTVEEPDPE